VKTPSPAAAHRFRGRREARNHTGGAQAGGKPHHRTGLFLLPPLRRRGSGVSRLSIMKSAKRVNFLPRSFDPVFAALHFFNLNVFQYVCSVV
jgi:hypothetical protein